MGTASRAARLATLAAALVCAACAPIRLQSDAGGLPPDLGAPLPLAGGIDERAAFAVLFREALLAEPAKSAAPPDQWLHATQEVRDADDRLALLKRRFAARAPSTSVLIVPGLFGDCFDSQSVPFGDGVVRTRERSATEAYAQYADLGLHGIRLLPVPGRSSSVHNGRLVADAVQAEADRPGVERIVLIAYSKGLPDALQGLVDLQAGAGVPGALVGLVSVAGVVMGTPVADQFESLFEALSPHVDAFDCSPSDGQELSSVTQRERSAWMARHPLPAGVPLYSVIARAGREEIAWPLRPFHARLAEIDPRNDGQMLAPDALLPGGTLLAEARADHWDLALPRDRHPNALVRATTSGRDYPREALLRSIVTWVVGHAPR